MHEHRPREEAALGILVYTRWEVQAGPDESVVGWLGLPRLATPAISAAVMGPLALMCEGLRADAVATGAYMNVGESDLAFVEPLVEWVGRLGAGVETPQWSGDFGR